MLHIPEQPQFFPISIQLQQRQRNCGINQQIGSDFEAQQADYQIDAKALPGF